MIGPAELAEAVRRALAAAGLPDREPELERPGKREHGEWATNVALTLAKPVGAPPREIAERIVDQLVLPPEVERVDVAGPGFLNFHFAHAALEAVVREAVTLGERWGASAEGKDRRVNVEFVSANPTGPLHVGAGRWAAVGDALASLLEVTGWDVTREYYFNDAGEQMERFGRSVASAMRGEEPPEDGYRGAYIGEIAEELLADGVDVADVEAVTEGAYGRMLERIKATLERFGVAFDVYFGERTLHQSGAIAETVAELQRAGHAYEAEGAVWLRTAAFGDDKDRVLIKANGDPTYFAADCAYLADKVARGFERCLYVLGADHHGYVKRMEAAGAAQGLPEGTVEVLIGQLVNFVRGGEAVRMSKRAGDLVYFDDLIEEVGVDAARYTFLRYSVDAPIDFDLDEVVRQHKDNPVYYVQYSSARIAGIMGTARERGVEPGAVDDAPLELLVHETEEELIRRIGAYPETIAEAAAERAPHKVARYAEGLAEAFHRFYTECRVVTDEPDLTRARYWLVVASRQTLVNALGVLGVEAPERM